MSDARILTFVIMKVAVSKKIERQQVQKLMLMTFQKIQYDLRNIVRKSISFESVDKFCKFINEPFADGQ